VPLPKKFWCFPGSQLVHVTEPAIDAFPFAQVSQALELFAPRTPEALPGGQSLQEVIKFDPVAVEYLPAVHFSHSDLKELPIKFDQRPGGHPVQELFPDCS
jgi:hypothetical protein